MTLTLREYTLGQLANNCYLLADMQTNQAVLIDPPMGVSGIVDELQSSGWQLSQILLTHGHFDHTYGIYELQEQLPFLPPITLHRGDADLYHSGGLGELMGLYREPLPPVKRWLEDGNTILLGTYKLQVFHCPGHTPGHVFYYSVDLNTAFVGDIIFRRGVGRTDLPGGNEHQLLASIRKTIFSLPPHIRLLNGHGPETSVLEELQENPFFL